MSKYADEGTIAHQLAALCLTEGTDAAAYIGRILESEDYEHSKLSPSNAKKWMNCPGSHALELQAAGEFEERSFDMEVTEDMARDVQVYVDMVRERVAMYEMSGAKSVELMVEQRLPIEHITGEAGAWGTGDVLIVVVHEDNTVEIDVVDLKFGRGVQVDATENDQLSLYGCGAIYEHSLSYDFGAVNLIIHQPRIDRVPSVWSTTAEALAKFEKHATERAFHATQVAKGEHPDAIIHHLHAGPWCRESFCKARATCPKLRDYVKESVFTQDAETAEDFANLEETTLVQVQDNVEDWLGAMCSRVDVIEDWCKEVRGEVEKRLLAGTPIPGWKLVKGRSGARAWSDKDEAEKTMKSMRLKADEMYTQSLISPTTAEKVLKETPKRWARLLPLITQAEGKPSVAPESDKRPALVITPVADDFDDLT